MSAAVVLAILLAVGLIWLSIRFTIWIIKTAIKEALREYDAEKGARNAYR